MKIVVVSDEPEIELLFTKNLQPEFREYSFCFLKERNEAINLIRSETKLGLVLIDLDSEKLDGLALLADLPQLNPSVLGVVMSVRKDLDVIRAAMNKGVFDFITKPLGIPDVLATLERAAEYVREAREQQHIKSLDELKSRFFDNITHEFRTPLTLILGPVEKMLRETHTESHRQNLQLVQRNARQLLRITNQLLDLARLEAGHLTVNPTAGNLGQFISQLAEAFQPLAEEKKISLVIQNKLSSGYNFDEEKIEQIVHNLLANALKFTVPDPSSEELKEVRIIVSSLEDEPLPSLWRSALDPDKIHSYCPHLNNGASSDCKFREGVHIVVKDSGVGIQPKRLPHVFDRFHMLSPKHVRPDVALVQPSTGIGLAFVKELAELMDGHICVTSAVHEGTMFSIKLPLTAVEVDSTNDKKTPALTPEWYKATSEDGTPTTGASGEKPVILVVEDDTELRTFMAEELSSDFQVLTAADGKLGWALVQAELPDLVISDVAMPNMDGFQLTDLIKRTPSTDHIAVVLLTSKINEKDILKGLEQGADVYLPKPFNLEELHLRLRNLLSHQRKLQQYYRQQLINSETTLEVEETVQDKFLRQVYELIEARIDDSTLSVESLAEDLSISRKTLYRKTSSLTKLSPNELIRQYRLRRAADLLKTGYNASETAYMVGFETPAYFGQCFKDQYGITPMEYAGKLTF